MTNRILWQIVACVTALMPFPTSSRAQSPATTFDELRLAVKRVLRLMSAWSALWLDAEIVSRINDVESGVMSPFDRSPALDPHQRGEARLL